MGSSMRCISFTIDSLLTVFWFARYLIKYGTFIWLFHSWTLTICIQIGLPCLLGEYPVIRLTSSYKIRFVINVLIAKSYTLPGHASKLVPPSLTIKVPSFIISNLIVSYWRRQYICILTHSLGIIECDNIYVYITHLLGIIECDNIYVYLRTYFKLMCNVRHFAGSSLYSSLT